MLLNGLASLGLADNRVASSPPLRSRDVQPVKRLIEDGPGRGQHGHVRERGEGP